MAGEFDSLEGRFHSKAGSLHFLAEDRDSIAGDLHSPATSAPSLDGAELFSRTLARDYWACADAGWVVGSFDSPIGTGTNCFTSAPLFVS